MKRKIIKITEDDLKRVVDRVVSEQTASGAIGFGTEGFALSEDSEGEETYHYGEDEGEDHKEEEGLEHEEEMAPHDRIREIEKHLDALKDDMDYDEDHEDRDEEGTTFSEAWGSFSTDPMKSAARKVAAAMEGWGTDEKALWAALETVKGKGKEFKAVYDEYTSDDLIQALDHDLSDADLQKALTILGLNESRKTIKTLRLEARGFNFGVKKNKKQLLESTGFNFKN